MDRHALRAAISKLIPKLVPWFELTHSEHAFLPDWVLLSRQGTQQGDPLGPAFFAGDPEALVERLKVLQGLTQQPSILARRGGGQKKHTATSPRDSSYCHVALRAQHAMHIYVYLCAKEPLTVNRNYLPPSLMVVTAARVDPSPTRSMAEPAASGRIQIEEVRVCL